MLKHLKKKYRERKLRINPYIDLLEVLIISFAILAPLVKINHLLLISLAKITFDSNNFVYNVIRSW